MSLVGSGFSLLALWYVYVCQPARKQARSWHAIRMGDRCQFKLTHPSGIPAQLFCIVFPALCKAECARKAYAAASNTAARSVPSVILVLWHWRQKALHLPSTCQPTACLLIGFEAVTPLIHYTCVTSHFLLVRLWNWIYPSTLHSHSWKV